LIVPAWYVGDALAGVASIKIQLLGADATFSWVFLPIVIPTWMVSFSFTVILMKWLIIWKYKEGIVSIPSFAYLQWWFVDRVVALWEFWVGRFILDCPLINVFYYLGDQAAARQSVH